VGNFFVNQYDLYSFVGSDVGKAISGLTEATKRASNEDTQQDVKDSCVSISEHNSYDEAFEDVDFLYNFLEDKIGIV
jgi:hypothetical protein